MYYVTKTRRYKGVYTCKVMQFPDIVAKGATAEEARAAALDKIEATFRANIRERVGNFPVPESAYAVDGIYLGVVKCVKILLFNVAMQKGHATQTARAQFLEEHIPSVDRMLDLNHNSRIDTLEHALARYGVRLVIEAHHIPKKGKAK